MSNYKVLCIALILLLQSCSIDRPLENEIIGNWYNKDGSEITLKKNGFFYGKDLSVYAFYHTDTIDKFYGNGKWEMLERNGKWIIDLNFKEKSIYGDKIVSVNSRLFITGDGFFGTKRPLHMYLQIGDPDEDNRYEFHKNK